MLIVVGAIYARWIVARRNVSVLWALQRERGIGGGANGTLPRPQGVASVWASERTEGNRAAAAPRKSLWVNGV